MSALTPELERKLGVAVERMPAFPRSVQKILEMSRNIACLPKDLLGVIEKDPVMTMKILKVINSAYYNLPNKITSVGHSVVILGINTIKNLALGIAAVGILPRQNGAGFDVQKYLLHSLVVAGTARQLALDHLAGKADPGDCYIAGLLHDFGKIVFAQYLAHEFREALAEAGSRGVPLHVAEREVIGIDHGRVGAQLAQRWQFPDHLVACIRDHHDAAAPATAMLDCLRVADQIVRFRQVGDSGNPWHADEACAAPQRFGDDLDELAASEAFDKIVREATMFAQFGAE